MEIAYFLDAMLDKLWLYLYNEQDLKILMKGVFDLAFLMEDLNN